ncbi:MAG TPA: FtsX-like permease family protein [Bacillota bacterium]|nr:FtsX-like permease family protein [Bacillota bacterium]
MAILKIAYKGFNKYRKRRKNLTVVLSGTFLLIFVFSALFSTINDNLRTFWVKDTCGGDFIVSKDLDFFDLGTQVPFENHFSYNRFLETNRKIEARVSPHLRTGVLLENRITNDSAPCMLTGLDLAREKQINDYIKLSEGRFFNPGKNEIILPEALAADIGAKRGEQIIIYANTKDGYQNYDLYQVVGYLELPPSAGILGQNVAFMPIDKIRELVMTENDTVSELLYQKKAFSLYIGLNRANLYKVIDGLASYSVVRSLSLAFRFMAIVIFILVIVFAVSSIYHNIALMSLERTGEIGIYLTYGAKPGWIRKLFLMELVLYTLFCSLFGAVLSYLAVTGINGLGIYPIDTATEMLMASSHFLMKISPASFGLTGLIMLGLVILGSIRPIWKSTGSERIIDLFFYQ